MLNYTVQNWYWVVGGSQVYSSASASYVPATDTTYAAWLAAGGVPTKITTNDMLLLQIDFLEAKQTLRRMREASSGTDGGWLASLNTQIAALREQIIP
jgi:hypothetical protein